MFEVRSQMVGARSLFVRSTVNRHMLFDIGKQVRAHTLRTNCCRWVELGYVILEMLCCHPCAALWTKNVLCLSICSRVICASMLSPTGSLWRTSLQRLFGNRCLHRLGHMWRLLDIRGALSHRVD